eukprot:m.119606 g.119606  ORF g.119606 m.119606 type:complete len:352 (+) comp28748_c0_seq1:153-1208(+)
MGVLKKAMYLPIILVVVNVTLSYMIGGWACKLFSPFQANAQILDLTGKVAIVTGGNTGIGRESVLELARNGAHVILAARNEDKGQSAADGIMSALKGEGGKVEVLKLDLGSLESVKAFADAFLAKNLPLHILLNNAGIMMSPGAMFIGKELDYGYGLTKDGFEQHIGVNHIGHFYLTQLLTEKLKASSPSRVVMVSSASEGLAYSTGIVFDQWTNKGQYEDGQAYGQSKLANLLHAQEFASKMNGTGVSAYACHPGVIHTELGRYMAAEGILGPLQQMFFNFLTFDAPGGALTQLYLATSDTASLNNGGFYYPIGVATKSRHPAASAELAKTLWEETEKAIEEQATYRAQQ